MALYATRMTHPANIIYLPPGVMPVPSGPQQQSQPVPNIPFDRNFFENVLPASVQSFCEQTGCDSPIVELFTIDGTRHFLKGISGVSPAWVALHTQSEEHDHAIQVFLPFQTIYRVEIHPEKDAEQRRLGFIVPERKSPARKAGDDQGEGA
jgi:hypothetical protein